MFRKIISSLIIFLFCFNITYSKNIIPYTTIPHLDTAISYYNRGVKEKTNNNDGKEVEMFLRYVGLPKGNPWCAAFISYCEGVCTGILNKTKSALARNFITKKSISAKDVLYGRVVIKPGTLVIFQKGNALNGHIGTVYYWDKERGQLVEGNAGDKVSFMERSIQPRNYSRIISFTIVEYDKSIQEKIDRYKQKKFDKTENSTVNESRTF